MNQDDVRADDTVSEAYRSLAVERTPESLDHAVLAEARQAVAAGKSRRWPSFRPLAWAATVALSFALVLQYTQTGPDVPAAIPEDYSMRQQATTAAETTASDDDELAEFDRTLDDAPAAPPADAAGAPAVKSEAAKLERVERLDVMSGPSGAVDRPEVVLPEVVQPDVVQESEATSNVRKSAEEARVRASSNLPETAARREARGLIATSGCDASTRTVEAAWRQCIEELIERGRHQLAEREADEFAEAFPEADPIDFGD